MRATTAIPRSRSGGGLFRIIEFRIGNATLHEVLTEGMQVEYRAGVALAGWRAFAASLSAQQAA